MLYEYCAEAWNSRTERREVFVYRVPAECAQVGEGLFISGILTWGIAASPLWSKPRTIRKIEVDERWHVRRFRIRWFGWTSWILDEDEIFLDAEHNPLYPRGTRRHERDDD
jgi:hypothetical protein